MFASYPCCASDLRIQGQIIHYIFMEYNIKRDVEFLSWWMIAAITFLMLGITNKYALECSRFQLIP